VAIAYAFRSFAYRLTKLDPWLYGVWAAAFTIASARMFYGYMLQQTGGEWSAPLDDVFIHFDYARSTARGHPLEWVSGNGVSSGNTSVSYPFVLAIGWLLGFQNERLMQFAAWLALLAVFGVLLLARDFFLTAFMLLGLGALNWSLWSGMEVAFFLGTWALACAAFLTIWKKRERASTRDEWLLGALCGLMFFTRPEALLTTAVFGLFAAHARATPATFIRICGTALVLFAVQAGWNAFYTGEFSQNGAIVKLAIENPFLSSAERFADYRRNLQHAVMKCLEYHFADTPPYGAFVPFLALCAFASRRARPLSLLLAMQIALWLLVVSLNGQVLWQNERYVMPAVLWLLLLCVLGVGALAEANASVQTLAGSTLVALAIGSRLHAFEGGQRTDLQQYMGSLGALLLLAAGLCILMFWQVTRIAVALATLCVLFVHQEPNMRGQKWFFGRASRNIRDQQTRLGRFLVTLPEIARGARVAVGDAGAILYASDAKGLDLIGLGGFHDYPFARANVSGIGATIELLERLSERDRPVYLALFPSWWGSLPHWFGSEVVARFPAEGNVICGDYEHVLYRADWHLLGSGEALRSMPASTSTIRDSIDVADIISERAHDYRWSKFADNGRTVMKILPADSAEPSEMFDAGRDIWPAQSESFRFGNLIAGRDAQLVIRTAPEATTTVHIFIDDVEGPSASFTRHSAFLERSVLVRKEQIQSSIRVRIENRGPGRFVNYHMYIAQ
jgi:hypothetical protein